MWPTIATLGLPSSTPTLTVQEPITSEVASPNFDAASRHTAAAGAS